jgi:hypothetical protein
MCVLLVLLLTTDIAWAVDPIAYGRRIVVVTPSPNFFVASSTHAKFTCHQHAWDGESLD